MNAFVDPIRQPWHESIRFTREDEAIQIAWLLTPDRQRGECRCRLAIERNRRTAPRLRGVSTLAGGSIDQCASDADRSTVEVDIAPPQREERSAARASCRCKDEECTEHQIDSGCPGDEDTDSVNAWRPNLWRYVARRTRVRCRIRPNPLPVHRLL